MIRNCLLTFLLLICACLSTQAQQKEQPIKTRILFLLDGSGSMLADWGGQTRMDKAKQVLSELVSDLESKENLELALRVYGHQHDRKAQNCEDTKLEVPFANDNTDEIKKALSQIDPKGTTPLAYSLEQSANDFKGGNYRNVIIIITDGIESCDGDPCSVALALQRKNIFLRPFIIGLGGQEGFAEAFSCLGKYYDAADVTALRSALDDIMKATLGKTTVRVELLDAAGNPTETNVNLSFINAVTGATEYDYVHYLENGKPDNLEIDAVRSYHLMVNTVPMIVRKDIVLKGGQENVIQIPAPQGYLKLRQDQHQQYKNLRAIFRENGKSNTLTVTEVGDAEKLLTGRYDIEVLTLPRVTFSNVEVRSDRTTTVDLPTPGVLSITDKFAGYGSLYQVPENGVETLIYRLEDNNTRQNITMQPGRYKLVFRSANAKGSEYTKVQYFNIRSGLTTKLSIY